MNLDIRQPVGYIPTDEQVTVATPGTSQGKINSHYQRWLKQVLNNVNDLGARQTPSLTYNPDFNWTRTKGTTPTTQADGDDASFIEQWFVFGASGNTYTITPTAYANDAPNPTGSKYYPHFAISALTEPFYIYNVNSNTDFNMAQKIQNQLVTLSIQLTNNLATTLKMRFNIETQGIADVQAGNGLYFPQGTSAITASIQMPALAGTTASANAYSRIQLALESMGGDNADFNINYIKSEISQLGMTLDVNHIEQKLLIDGLNS